MHKFSAGERLPLNSKLARSEFQVERALERFRANVESVYELAGFDRVVLAVAISTLEELQTKLQAHFENKAYLATNALEILKNVRQNDSLRPKYRHALNQCVVLLVSYFSSAVSDVFRLAFRRSLEGAAEDTLHDEEMKLSLKEIIDLESNPGERMPDVFVQKRDISFQDMQSILRTFERCFHVAMVRNAGMNDIILGQAARHVIVHAAARIDHKMVVQVSKACPRSLKEKIREGDAIDFSVEEIRSLGASMVSFVEELEGKI